MKERDFDIAIREILQGAEEPVSPHVWEGVEAGLNRRRIFPVWAWGIASVAAAAAVVLGVFLLGPGKTAHSNPTISIVETPKATVPSTEPAPEMEEIVPMEEQVARKVSRLAYVPEPLPAVPAAAENPVLAPEEAEAQAEEKENTRTIASVQSEKLPESAVEDVDAFNQLVYSQTQKKEPRGFSFTAAGNIQSNSRTEVPSGSGYRAPGTIPLLAPAVDHGVFNEQPELNFSLPFSLGVGVKYHFNSRLALGTGIRYTYMSRTFLADYRDIDQNIHIVQTDVDNHQHWLGVPLNFYFNIIDNGRWRLHTFLGGAGEFLVDNDYLIHASPKDIHYHQRGNSIQWSAAGGLGVEFRLTPTVGLFVDPSIRYYFGAASQPRSIRTIQPLRMEVEAGVRFSLGAK
jgi:hypothetical protein